MTRQQLAVLSIRLLAGLLFAAVVWALFRFAMGLRWSKVSRDRARREEESQGRRVVAEIPLSHDLIFFVEEDDAFRWGAEVAEKSGMVGARLLLNGGVMSQVARKDVALPDPSPPQDYEGGERWEVALFMTGDRRRSVPCGTLREGVSREIATRVFEAVRRALVQEASR